MAGKKITARKARQARNARNARDNARKVRKANAPYEIISSYTVTLNSPSAPRTFPIRSLDEISRHSRRYNAKNFLFGQKVRGAYPCGDVNKTMVGRFCQPYSWTEADKSTGFQWVALHGLDFVTVVFKKDENLARRAGYGKPLFIDSYYEVFCSTVVTEMEDIGGGTIRPGNKKPPGIPFAVVCETTSSTNVQEAVNAAPDLTASAEFLHNEFMKGFSMRRSSKYIKTAISALQILHKQTFKADEIWVGLWGLRDDRGRVSHDSLDEYLAEINRPDSGGCSKEHSHDINGGFFEDRLAVNEPDSGGYSKEDHSHDINGGFSKDHLAVNEPDSGGCSKEDHSHDSNGGFSKDQLAVNEPESGGCSKEEHSHDINGGFFEDHLAVNVPDNGGCTEEHSQYM